MEKIIITSYERIVKFSDIKDIFQETILLCENEESFMIGAILNNGEIVCIARFFNRDSARLFYAQLHGIYHHLDLYEDIFNVNLEIESLKIVEEVLDAIGKPGEYVREMLLKNVIKQFFDGIQLINSNDDKQ